MSRAPFLTRGRPFVMIVPMSRWRPVGEGVLFYVVALCLVWVWREGLLLSAEGTWWLIPLTWIVMAVLATWQRVDGARDLFTSGQWIGVFSETMRSLLVITVIVLPSFTAAYLVYRGGWGGSTMAFSWPEGWEKMAFYQMVYVAFPEELFFRGYLQQRFDDAFGRPYRLFGASFGSGLITANLLFTAGHVVVSGDVGRLAVFFPGLLFGWLQARTGALIAPILFHGLCNIVLYTLQAWVG